MKMFSLPFNKAGITLVVATTFLLSIVAVVFGQVRQANGSMWSVVDETSLDQSAERLIVPQAYRTVRLDRAALQQALAEAPMEFTRNATQNPVIYLPMPDGTMARFRFEESPVVEAGLAAKYPELKTYRAQGIDDPTATSRFDWLPTGFHAIILSARGTVLIDPYARGNTTDYITYWKRDAANLAQPWECQFDELPPLANTAGGVGPAVTSGTQLRTYRLALACTNEYAVAVGANTVAGSLAAEVLIMNRVNGVYERDVAIHMNIIANNNLITYAGDNTSCGGPCTGANDPYTNTDNFAMLDQNQSNIDAVIGSANYDIGHVFGTNGGGVAQLAVPCTGSKARGMTSLPSPLGDPFAIDYVSHEMGHQWGANHTFNTTTGNCGGGNRSAGSAYEPGSGATIMAYTGLCGNQNLVNLSFDNFHVKSLEAMVAYSQTGGGNSCAVTTASGNTPPTVTGPGTFTIPKRTPFSLAASATDPNGDTITYDWQEYDLGAPTTATPNTDADGQPRPIFRPYLPVSGGTRTFPSLQFILNNANVPPTFMGGFLTGELLPAITRTMTFQVVARDNRAGAGGIGSATAIVNIDGNSGPFAVTSPNVSFGVQVNTNFTVTWDVAGSAGAPVNAANVKISLSTDGGNTFPTVLNASTANDGSETILIPNTPTATARVKVEGVGNIFFDISDVDFGIVTGQPSPTPTATVPPSPSPTPGCTPSWAAGPNMPVAGAVRAPGSYFPANGRFYSIGGRSADVAGADFTNPFEYDPATNTWATKPSLLPDGQVNNMACGVMSVGGTDQIYCVGGSQSQVVGTASRVFSYNPATDTFTTLTAADNWPGSQGGTFLPGGFAVAENKLYIIGSFNASGVPPVVTGQVWEFDPTAAVGSRWLQRADLPVTRGYVPAASIGGFIYTAGGSNLDAGGTLVDTADSFKYDPALNTWTAIANIPRATAETRAVVMNKQMWVLGGGRSAPNPSNEVNIYDPGTNTWTTGASFTTARRNFPADSDGTSRVFIAGGYDTSGTTLLNTMELFPSVCATPSPTPTATATSTGTPPAPTPTPTPTPTLTPGVSPSPSVPPAARALNLSTRMRVLTEANVGIGGFIVTGTAPKTVLLRGIGPSLGQFGVPDPLVDPVMELNGSGGFVTLTNDNWRDDHEAEIEATGLAPTNDLESAILATLPPGNYTAIVKGKDNGIGVGLVEAYDLDGAVAAPAGSTVSRLGNISTRAFVGTEADVMIAGFILGGSTGDDNVILRGIGPSLTQFGVPDALQDPTLELRDNNGALLVANDNWQDDPVQAGIISGAGLAPSNAAESAIARTLSPGTYTAVLAGKNNGTGVGLVEAYDLATGGPFVTPTPGATPTATIPGSSPTPTATATAGGNPCTENFDSVTAPALPAGWTAINPDPGDGVMWETSISSPDSAPNCVFINDQDGISDKVLDWATVTINNASAVISWRNNFNTEFSDGIFWDGYVLEVSSPNISGGAFLDVTDSHVGGSFISGGYTGEIDGTANNPLAGRMAWSADSGGYIDTAINLGPNVAGQTITLRFRMGTDEAVAAPGVRMDNIAITNSSCP